MPELARTQQLKLVIFARPVIETVGSARGFERHV